MRGQFGEVVAGEAATSIDSVRTSSRTAPTNISPPRRRGGLEPGCFENIDAIALCKIPDGPDVAAWSVENFLHVILHLAARPRCGGAATDSALFPGISLRFGGKAR